MLEIAHSAGATAARRCSTGARWRIAAMHVFVSSKERMGRSVQFGSRRDLTLGRTLERRIVDANPIEEPRRPSRRLDRLQDNGLALAPNGDGVPFQVEFRRQ